MYMFSCHSHLKTNANFCVGWARLCLVLYFLTRGWSNQANSPQLATLNAADLLMRLPVFPQWPVPVPLLCWRQASIPRGPRRLFQQGEREDANTWKSSPAPAHMAYGNGWRMFKTWCLLCKQQIAQHRIKSQLRSRTLRWCFSRSCSST